MGDDEEIELKFTCGPEDLAAVLAAAPPGDDDHAELISVYFDTADLALQKAGASLRVRESKGRRVQTLKRGDGLRREEHESAIEGLAPDPSLGPLSKLVPDGAHLRPAFNVAVSRRQRRLRYEGAEIELALDQGEVVGGEDREPICEVELELKSGDPAALFALARELADAAPLYLSFDSKASRGQALVSGDAEEAQHSRAVELTGDETVAGAFQVIVRAAMAQIAANAAILRTRPTPEAVHQLRVGARRLRSALSTFGKALADPQLENVKADLRWLAHACDRIRNLDVYAEALPAGGDAAPSAGLAALQDALLTARAEARKDVAGVASSERFRRLMIEVAAWAETGGWLANELAQGPIRPFADGALDRRRKEMLKLGRGIEAADDAALHKLRIAAKKIRYAGDALAGLYPKKRVRGFVGQLKDLQGELGELNDIATVGPLLESLDLAPAAALVAGENLGTRRAERPARVRRASKAFAKLVDARPFWRA